MITQILLALGGVVISILVGTLWYAPKSPMGKIHMQYLGFDKLSPEEQKQKIEEAKPGMPKIYAAQAVLSLLTASAVVMITTLSLQNGLSFGLALGFLMLNWLCFAVPMVGMNILWGNCDRKIAWQKFISDSLNSLVTILLIASLVFIVMQLHG
jgi:hypothetical protein